MTEAGPPPTEAPPRTPQSGWDQRDRLETLGEWITVQRRSFTDEAIRRSAIAAGWDAEEFDRAAAAASAREALVPIRSRARAIVLGAYAIVWLLFAIPFLLLSEPTTYGFGPLAQLILTIVLGIALALSLVVIRSGRPDSSRSTRAIVILLALPVVLLLGVAGLCLPFARVS